MNFASSPSLLFTEENITWRVISRAWKSLDCSSLERSIVVIVQVYTPVVEPAKAVGSDTRHIPVSVPALCSDVIGDVDLFVFFLFLGLPEREGPGQVTEVDTQLLSLASRNGNLFVVRTPFVVDVDVLAVVGDLDDLLQVNIGDGIPVGPSHPKERS